MGRGVGVVGLLAVACGPSPEAHDPDRLPRAVVVSMVVGGGQPLTAWFSVEPNARGHVDVRVANGLDLPGVGGVFGLDPVDPARSEWQLVERVGGALVPLDLPKGGASLRPVRVDRDEVWLFPRDATSGWACALQGGACRAVAGEPPEPELTRPGPGGGFRLELDDGTLRFRQPHQDASARADVIATRVVAVVGVRWVTEAPEPHVVEYVDRTFRGRSSLRARFGEVVVDGVLDEWDDVEAEVVEAPWQAARRDDWNGPDDGSFSVGARWSEDDLCLAGRLRDDFLTADDSLTVVLKKERYELPLANPELADFEAAVTPEVFGWHYELCLPRPGWTEDRADRPFAVMLRDADAGSEADLLATAPVFGQFPVGTLELAP